MKDQLAKRDAPLNTNIWIPTVYNGKQYPSVRRALAAKRVVMGCGKTQGKYAGGGKWEDNEPSIRPSKVTKHSKKG